ncbi:reverse transcriptase family protein [Kiritimatiellaeota bacterium B1221]|nr:reverse transcriptase family protein [Kiritimatiellaeota bacterium B1221]
MNQCFSSLTLEQLSPKLGVGLDKLGEITQKAPTSYRVHKEKKKSGGFRNIEAPNDDLKKVQRNILKHVFNKVQIDPAFYGVTGTCMVDAIRMHCQKPLIISMDVQNFFPSVTREEIRHALLTRGMSKEVVKVIARLTTYQNRLPQGAPTSPILAALVLQPKVREILNMLDPFGAVNVSVYVDDITISGPQGLKRFIKPITNMIEDGPFSVHPGKTKKMYPQDPPVVLGVEIRGHQLTTTPEFEAKLLDARDRFGSNSLIVKGMINFQQSLNLKKSACPRKRVS